METKKEFPKFGSVEWQKMRIDEIMFKTINGIPLDEFDKAFILIQQEHLGRWMLEEEKAKKKLKGVD